MTPRATEIFGSCLAIAAVVGFLIERWLHRPKPKATPAAPVTARISKDDIHRLKTPKP